MPEVCLKSCGNNSNSLKDTILLQFLKQLYLEMCHYLKKTLHIVAIFLLNLKKGGEKTAWVFKVKVNCQWMPWLCRKASVQYALHIGTAFEFMETTQIHEVILISNCKVVR